MSHVPASQADNDKVTAATWRSVKESRRTFTYSIYIHYALILKFHASAHGIRCQTIRSDRFVQIGLKFFRQIFLGVHCLSMQQRLNAAEQWQDVRAISVRVVKIID